MYKGGIICFILQTTGTNIICNINNNYNGSIREKNNLPMKLAPNLYYNICKISDSFTPLLNK